MRHEILILEKAKKFLDELELKLKAKSFRAIQLLSEFGPNLPEPHSKKIVGVSGLFELRVKQGSNICRFFYFHYRDKVYVVTSGYVKKDQKINRNEIDQAIKLMKEYRDKSI